MAEEINMAKGLSDEEMSAVTGGGYGQYSEKTVKCPTCNKNVKYIEYSGDRYKGQCGHTIPKEVINAAQ